MNRNALPKTPAQAWRELEAEERAFKVGLVLRAVWELAKPVIVWTFVFFAIGVWAIFSFLIKAVLGTK